MKRQIGLLAAAALAVGAAPDPATELNNRGTAFYQQARYSDAEALYRRALESWTETGPQGALQHARILGNLAEVLRITGQYREAEPVLLEALRETEAAAGAGSADAAIVLERMAVLYRSVGRLGAAEDCALKARPKLEGPERSTNALILASVYLEQRRFAEAGSVLRATLEANPDGPIGTTASVDLTAAAIGEGDLSAAAEHAGRAVESARRSFPPNHPTLAIALNNRAQVYRLAENYLEAERDYRQAIGIWENAFGPAHPDVADGLMNLAALFHGRERESGAEEMYRRAAGIFEQALGSEALRTLVARNELADVLRAERRYIESERVGGQSLAAMERAFAPDDPRLLRALANYAHLLVQTKRRAEAEAVLGSIRKGTSSFQ